MLGLLRIPDKSAIVMDNADFHKSIEMQQVLQVKGHTILFTYILNTNGLKPRQKDDKPNAQSQNSFYLIKCNYFI